MRALTARYGYAFLLIAVAILHGAFAWHHRGLRAELSILDPPPGNLARSAFAFGDDQFLYRYWAHELQNAGDTGGRSTALRDYNYDYVMGWLEALQALDSKSQIHPYLATKYFGLTPKLEDVRRAVSFIVDDVTRNPELKWYWLTQAIDKAERTLKDAPYALALSQQLASYDYPDMPTWTWLFPAVLLRKMERYDEAREVIAKVRREKAGRLEPETMNWMDAFELELPN